jgi:hypothetical protein
MSNKKVIDRIVAILKVKHHPSICPTKGLYGKDCKNCDPSGPKKIK